MRYDAGCEIGMEGEREKGQHIRRQSFGRGWRGQNKSLRW